MAVAAEPAALPVSPSLDEVRALARHHNLVPVRHSFIDDCETPVAAFLKLRGTEPQSAAFLLESAEQGQRVGRYSFIGVRPRAVVRWSLGDEGDPYALAAREVGRYRQAPLPDLPPFSGGAVGYFGYDLVRTVEPLGDPNPDELGLPDLGHGVVGDRVRVSSVLQAPAQHALGAPADERPAPDALALLSRLQQEGGPVAAQLEEGGHRRLAVLDERVRDGDQVVVAGELAGCVEARPDLERFMHDGQRAPPRRPRG